MVKVEIALPVVDKMPVPLTPASDETIPVSVIVGFPADPLALLMLRPFPDTAMLRATIVVPVDLTANPLPMASKDPLAPFKDIV